MFSTSIEILKSPVSKYEMAELHIEHYISFYAILIPTYVNKVYFNHIFIILAAKNHPELKGSDLN